MSEVSKNISELLSGTYGKAIVVGGTVYVIKAPSIKVIMRATQYLSKVDLPENGTVRELMKVAPVNLENIVKGLSFLVVGDVPNYQKRAESLERQMLSGSKEESDSKTQVVGGNTIVGSITLFMENLNLSYREVYEDLPYLLLLLMSADKPRAVYEDKEKTEVKKMSGKDLMRQKRGA